MAGLLFIENFVSIPHHKDKKKHNGNNGKTSAKTEYLTHYPRQFIGWLLLIVIIVCGIAYLFFHAAALNPFHSITLFNIMRSKSAQ
jgi:hypothetical protein